MDKPLIISYYLPQYHPFPLNDEWWGKGFTEWTNVGKAKPLYKGHYQPKVPADLGYYDLRLPIVREQQAELAREAGINAFCYWHYWFGGEGRQLLNEIIDEVRVTGKPNFPFCLGWANETWKSKQWNKDGLGDKILIEQCYGGLDDYRLHFDYVLPLFLDDRYVKIEGMPVFLVYRPFQHPEMSFFIEKWNEWAREKGFMNGIYFVARVACDGEDYSKVLNMGFNAVTFERTNRILLKEASWKKYIKFRLAKWFNIPNHYSYQDAMKYFTDYPVDILENVIPSLIPNWDHSPRSGAKGFILDDSKPVYFKKHVENVFELVSQKNNKLIFLKSWNEWAEGNYMEPDLKYGKGYIQALRNSLDIFFK